MSAGSFVQLITHIGRHKCLGVSYSSTIYQDYCSGKKRLMETHAESFNELIKNNVLLAVALVELLN